MKKYSGRVIIFSLVGIDVILLFRILLSGKNFALLNAQGVIAIQERNLIFTAVSLMLLLAIPTVMLAFFVAWKYRSSNTGAVYTPDAKHSALSEIFLWVVPVCLVIILAFLTWQSTHALDPYKPLQSTRTPLTIQVIALRWKWLFIYPQQHIATVNFIEFPSGTPVNFQLTADAPMTSFWIPQLGGQMYAMTGMSTQIHLQSDRVGSFSGRTAEINGEGYAGMKFVAQSVSQSDFDEWVQSVQHSSNRLNFTSYKKLAEPSSNTPQASYALVDKSLYTEVIMQFLAPDGSGQTMAGM